MGYLKQTENYVDMKEKEYPYFEEEENAMAAEPMQSMAMENIQRRNVRMHDEADNVDWDNYPVFGPKTMDEAIARIDKVWDRRNDQNKWMTSEDLDQVLSKNYPWLR